MFDPPCSGTPWYPHALPPPRPNRRRPHMARPYFLFIDARLPEVSGQIVAAVDPRALAAHEFWHRQTEGRWGKYLQEIWEDDEDVSGGKPGISGSLRSIEVVGDPWKGICGGNYATQGSSPGTSIVVIQFFKNIDYGDVGPINLNAKQVEVVFEVSEFSPLEFLVRVMQEDRRLIGKEELWQQKEWFFDKVWRNTEPELLGTDIEFGRVRRSDLINSAAAAVSRHAACRVFEDYRACRK